MAHPKDTKTPAGWPIDSSKTPPTSARQTPQPPQTAADRGAGRVVHDSRGNAVWDWLKETGRIAIESTSALLKRLEVPELKMEGEKDEDLRLESERDPGGGYDPYNQRTPASKGKIPGKTPGRK